MRMRENKYYETWNAFIECVDKRKEYGTMYRPEDYKQLKEKLLVEVKMAISLLEYEKIHLIEKKLKLNRNDSQKLSEIIEMRDRLEMLEILLVVSPEDISIDDYAETYVYMPYQFMLRLLIITCFVVVVYLACTKV